MTLLSEYLASNGIKQRNFAKKLGVDQSIVSRLARGDIQPSLKLAFDIERLTEKFVPASSWISSGDDDLRLQREQSETAPNMAAVYSTEPHTHDGSSDSRT